MEGPVLIIDLEATCWERRVAPSGSLQSVDEMEIIELGCVIATLNGEVLASRSFLVKPKQHPKLSSFCQQLTSITQDMVDNAPTYPEAIEELNLWLQQSYPVTGWAS